MQKSQLRGSNPEPSHSQCKPLHFLSPFAIMSWNVCKTNLFLSSHTLCKQPSSHQPLFFLSREVKSKYLKAIPLPLTITKCWHWRSPGIKCYVNISLQKMSHLDNVKNLYTVYATWMTSERSDLTFQQCFQVNILNKFSRYIFLIFRAASVLRPNCRYIYVSLI